MATADQVAAAQAQFLALWAERTDEAPPPTWASEVAPFLRSVSMGIIAEAMDIAGAADLDPSRAAGRNPRWRYFLGVLRNRAREAEPSDSPPPPLPRSVDPVLERLDALTALLERLTIAVEKIAARP